MNFTYSQWINFVFFVADAIRKFSIVSEYINAQSYIAIFKLVNIKPANRELDTIPTKFLRF